MLQTRQGQLIASPEEIAFPDGWIDAGRLITEGQKINNEYGRALVELAGQNAGS